MKKDTKIIALLDNILEQINVEANWLEIIMDYHDNEHYYDFKLGLLLNKLKSENQKLYEYVDEITH